VGSSQSFSGNTSKDRDLVILVGDRADRGRRADDSSKCMLLIDDDLGCLEGIHSLLSLRLPDAHVYSAATVGAALALIRAQDFDVVLSDVQMLDMDGGSLIADIKRTSPHTAVVLMTGNVNLLPNVLESGALSFMRKPVDQEYCVAALRHGVVYHSLSKAIHAHLPPEDRGPARAGLLRLAKAELAESRRRWISG